MSSDVSAVTKHWPTANEGFITTAAAPGVTSGGTTVPLTSVTGLTNASTFVGIIEPGLTNEQVFTGTVDTAGTQITGVVWTRGVNVAHSTGVTIVDYVTGTATNMITKGIKVEHNDDGTHGAVNADSLHVAGTSHLVGNVTIDGNLTVGTVGGGGWDPISGTVTAVTNNGQRSYDLAVSADNTASISPGMKLRTTRTVAAPIRCTSLNGTNQYYSKSSPSGLTFTDDFCAGAWIKMSSYNAADMIVISRYNGTSGWRLYIGSDGSIIFAGYNASVNNISYVQSYNAVPLNRWVHIAAQLDMSAFTATPTTSYIMMDGQNIPVQALRGGTAPTALVQAGSLEVGSSNGGTTPFPGKIAQAFISSAKITQANMKLISSQGLTAALVSTHSIASAFSFDNSLTDLNTTSANNLTANNSAVATNADSPFGNQAGGTISSTLDYAVVTKITASTITAQVPEGCTVPTSGGLDATNVSSVDKPYGFPAQKGKWTILSCFVPVALGVVSLTYYSGITVGAGTTVLNFPIGEWDASYDGSLYGDSGSAVVSERIATLSTSASVATDYGWLSHDSVGTTSSNSYFRPQMTKSGHISATAAIPYYVLGQSAGTTGNHAWSTTSGYGLTIKAENAYI